MCGRRLFQVSPEWTVAVFAALNGPVAGSTILLRTALCLHHPEAFESFFLHVAPMVFVYVAISVSICIY